MKKSEADKFFEENNFIKEENLLSEDRFILYRKELFGFEKTKDYKEIVFILEKRVIDIRTESPINHQTITTILNMNELQAINKKVEELGWK